MEHDLPLNEEAEENQDIIYSKIISVLKESKNILHKKALILIKSINSQYGSDKLMGLDGVQFYTKTFIDLLLKIVNKYSDIKMNNLEENELIEDTLNFEALIFTLAICCKQLSDKILHNKQLITRVINIINFALGINIKKIFFRVNFYCYKYILNIIDSFIISRTKEELNNDKDEIVLFFKNVYMKILLTCMKMKQDVNLKEEYDLKNINFNFKDLNSSLLKVICNLIQKKGELVQYSIVYEVVSYIIKQIQNINANLKIIYDNQNNSNNLNNADLMINSKLNSVNKNEINNALLFLSGLIQFLSYDFFNDILQQLIQLMQIINPEEEIEEKNETIINIMINCLLCIDISFNTHTLSEDINEKTLTILLNKNIFSQLRNSNKDEFNEDLDDIAENNKKNKKYKISTDIYDKLIIAYLKAISSIVIKVSDNDVFKSYQYFIGILSKYSEVLIESNNFVKNSIFSVLQNLIQKLFDAKKISKLKISLNNSNNNDLIKFDKLDINEEKKKQITENEILSKVAKIMLYFVSSRFTDKKIGFNLLLLFIEKINQAKKTNSQLNLLINELNEQIIFSLSEMNIKEKEKEKSEVQKIFIGKCFNYIHSNIILKYYPLGILDFDIESETYTDNSNVWIISYIDKFLLKEDNIQTIEDYVQSFMETINEIEHMIIKLKVSPVNLGNEENDMEIQEDEDNDEKFEVNLYENKHMRDLKIKRYQLIMTQIFLQINKFTNYCNNYSQYINAFITKFKGYFENKDSCQILINNLNEITFKFLYKIIINAQKNKDEQAIEVIKENGLFFFEKILNLILNDKLNKSETALGFNVINKFCGILSKQNIIKIIIDMVQKFDKTINDIFNTTDDNKNKIVKEPSKKQREKNDKEINKLAVRLEIADYLLKNLNFVVKNNLNNNPNATDEDNMINIVLQFFDKYFFFFSDNKNVKIGKEGMSSLQPLLTKKLFEIFYDIITKCNDIDYVLIIFNKFTKEKKGLSLITSKQQCKIFEFIINQIIKKNESLKNISFNNLEISLELLIAIASLTKDINKKVRNTSFEILGNITTFCSKHNLLGDWLKINISLLSSKNTFVESAGINSLSRIFWEIRNSDSTTDLMISNSDAVLAYFPFNNKEIIKSLFLYVRVLLYIIKISPPKNKNKVDSIIHKIIFCSSQQINEQMQKEFKVKLRNLYKNLIINYGLDFVKNSIDANNTNFKNFVQYVNKTLVKKFNNINEDENANENYDNTVMMDNDNNLLDEEEDYIKNEFKKINKGENNLEKKFLEKVEKLKLTDENLDEMRKQELESINKKENKEEEKMDKIEQLFKKDYVNLNNFFYINPFASGNNVKYDEQQLNKEKKENKNDINKTKEEKDKDVIYDTKKGKFIIKDLEKEIEIAKLNKKRKRQMKENDKNLEYQNDELKKQALLKGKKNKNIMKDDLLDLKNDESEDDENTKTKKKKISEKEEKKIKIKTMVDSHGKKTSHYVKYSGDEYKSKKGKGDKIIHGKYEPFAYIQLNPKSLNNKGERENAKIWENLMKNDNK